MPLYAVSLNAFEAARLAELRRLCEAGTQAHGGEFYDDILYLFADVDRPRLLDFPSSNQALHHVARPMFDVKLVKSVAAVARLMAAGVKIETPEGEPLGFAPAEDGLQPGESEGDRYTSRPGRTYAERSEQAPAPPAEAAAAPRRPGRPRKTAAETPPQAQPAAAPGGEWAAEVARHPPLDREAPTASEALLIAEADRRAVHGVRSPSKSLFERMSNLARDNSPAPASLPPEARANREGAATSTAPPPNTPPPRSSPEAERQEGADQQRSDAAPSEDPGDGGQPDRPEPMFEG